MNITNDNGVIAKEELSKKIEGHVVDIRRLKTDKHGRLYASIYLEGVCINHWLLKHKYVVECINGKPRRLSESDSLIHEKSNKSLMASSPILPNIYPSDISNSNSNSFLSSSKTLLSITSSTTTINSPVLPQILFSTQKSDNSINSSGSSTIQTDCFLSHNWGENHINHEFVKKVNSALRKRKIKTWFDERKIDGNIRFKMAEGIDNTKCVVVFITKEYREKVNGVDMKDNCKYEFTYAMNQLGSQNMIPIVMESDMRDTHKWKGELGAALGSILYIDFSCVNSSVEEVEKKYDELCRRIHKIINKTNSVK
jgi:hypothetical protein